MTKKDGIVYWTTTGIVCSVMVFSIVNFTFIDRFPFPEGAFVHLGLPNYFRTEIISYVYFIKITAPHART